MIIQKAVPAAGTALILTNFSCRDIITDSAPQVGGCSPFIHKNGGLIAMDTYVSLSDLVQFVLMLTAVVTLCYLVFNGKRRK